jgi:putative hydrolase of the HAD superfamily
VTARTDIRAVWTDFGGVLTEPIAATMAAFCRRVGTQPRALRHAMAVVAGRYGTSDLMEPLDTPLVTQQEWARQVEQVLRTEYGSRVDLSDFAATWFTDRAANAQWLDVLVRIRQRGTTVGLLSNMVPAWDPYWRRMVPPDRYFDEVVLSFQVGHRKPGRDIFELARRRVGATPQQCVLVDDLPDNCAGAEAAGWRAVAFTTAPDAAARLDQLLCPLST